MKKVKERKTAKSEKIEEDLHRRHDDHGDLLTDPSHHRIPVPPAKVPSRHTLGSRIHEARELRGLTLQDLSSRTGISLETLEKVEANKMIPPLGELIKLGKALEMKMGYFISPGVEKPMTVVHSDKRRVVSRHGKKKSEQYGYFYESLARLGNYATLTETKQKRVLKKVAANQKKMLNGSGLDVIDQGVNDAPHRMILEDRVTGVTHPDPTRGFLIG